MPWTQPQPQRSGQRLAQSWVQVARWPWGSLRPAPAACRPNLGRACNCVSRAGTLMPSSSVPPARYRTLCTQRMTSTLVELMLALWQPRSTTTRKQLLPRTQGLLLKDRTRWSWQPMPLSALSPSSGGAREPTAMQSSIPMKNRSGYMLSETSLAASQTSSLRRERQSTSARSSRGGGGHGCGAVMEAASAATGRKARAERRCRVRAGRLPNSSPPNSRAGWPPGGRRSAVTDTSALRRPVAGGRGAVRLLSPFAHQGSGVVGSLTVIRPDRGGTA